jgi:hypothetical protein
VVVYEDDLAYKIQLNHGLRLNKVLSAGRDKVLLTKYKFVTNTYYLLSSLTIFNDWFSGWKKYIFASGNEDGNLGM